MTSPTECEHQRLHGKYRNTVQIKDKCSKCQCTKELESNSTSVQSKQLSVQYISLCRILWSLLADLRNKNNYFTKFAFCKLS